MQATNTTTRRKIISQNKVRLYEDEQYIHNMLNEYAQRTGKKKEVIYREALDVLLTGRPRNNHHRSRRAPPRIADHTMTP